MTTGLQPGLLGSAIRKARMDKHISQEELAERIGITPTHLKHIESEHRKPSVDVLYRIVQIVNLSLDNLFFPERHDGLEEYRKAERLLRQCDVKQLRVVYAAMEAMLEDV
ncbi:MAG: helix-turn-helix transcriptional regulator [Ethanoligenens sp.]